MLIFRALLLKETLFLRFLQQPRRCRLGARGALRALQQLGALGLQCLSNLVGQRDHFFCAKNLQKKKPTWLSFENRHAFISGLLT